MRRSAARSTGSVEDRTDIAVEIKTAATIATSPVARYTGVFHAELLNVAASEREAVREKAAALHDEETASLKANIY